MLGSWNDSVTLFCFAASITTCHWWLLVFHSLMSQQIWWLCQTLSSIGPWVQFTLDHLIGLQVACEWVPCSVCCGQVNLWLRIPQTVGRKASYRVCLMWHPRGPCYTHQDPYLGYMKALCSAGEGLFSIVHQKHFSCFYWGSIFNFCLMCSQSRAKMNYLYWKLEMLGLKANISERVTL